MSISIYYYIDNILCVSVSHIIILCVTHGIKLLALKEEKV